MIGKKAIARKLLGTDAADQLSNILASIEHEMLETAVALEDAHGIDNIDQIPSVDQRQAALKALFEAILTDGMDEVWLEEVAPALVDDPESVEPYLGMDDKEWSDQIGRWAETYRDGGASGSDRALAGHHVEQKFGVDLATFEERVVCFDAGQEAEHLFAGNFRAVKESMELAREEATA
jgi:hypothetical protein